MSPEQTRRVFPQGSPEPGLEVEVVRYAGAPDGGVWFERQGVARGRPPQWEWVARGPNADGAKRFWVALTCGGTLVDCTDEVRRG